MDTLTPRQRDLVLARCRDDLTIGETAARLGIGSTTVKKHNAAVLKAFGRASMQGACWDAAHEVAYREALATLPLSILGFRAEQV